MAGDSITQGVLHTYGARCWVEHLHERLRWQLDRLFDAVVNSGMSGWTAARVLAHFDHLIGRHAPKVVGLSLGTNDCLGGAAAQAGFHTALDALIGRAQDLGAQVIVQTPVPVTRTAPAARQHFLARHADTARQCAAQRGCVLVDHHAHWLAQVGDAPEVWMDDHTHPNAAGHLEMAQHLLQTLGLGALTDVRLGSPCA